jgi:hypothetical protein
MHVICWSRAPGLPAVSSATRNLHVDRPPVGYPPETALAPDLDPAAGLDLVGVPRPPAIPGPLAWLPAIPYPSKRSSGRVSVLSD